MAVNDISPELALVDVALAARERARLPDPEDCLAPPPATPPAVVTPVSALTVVAPPEPEAPPAGAEMPALLAPEPEPEPEPALDFEPVSAEVLTEDEAVDVLVAEAPPAPVEIDVEAAVEAEPLTEPEPAPEVRVPSAEPDDAPAEPAAPQPAVPARMPDWVASDEPPKSRRARRKDRARGRRDGHGREKRPMRRRVAVAASWVVLCGFLASPLLAFIPSPNGERPTLAPDGAAAAPDAGESGGPVLRWEPVAKAEGYSVVFVNDGVRSDRWSQTARLRLPAGTEAEQLVTYEWFVYPAFRDGAGYRYGPLVASGEVTMPRLAPNETS